MPVSNLYANAKTIERSKERIFDTNEVFSSPELVKKMFDMWPSEVWLDYSVVWLEPTCGDGNILVAIHSRLMESLKSQEPDDVKRHAHIIENMLYGVDIMQDNIDHCIDRLNARGLKHNIVCADALTYDFSFGITDTECEGLIEIPSSTVQQVSPIEQVKKPQMVLVDSGLFG